MGAIAALSLVDVLPADGVGGVGEAVAGAGEEGGAVGIGEVGASAVPVGDTALGEGIDGEGDVMRLERVSTTYAPAPSTPTSARPAATVPRERDGDTAGDGVLGDAALTDASDERDAAVAAAGAGAVVPKPAALGELK
jgi:hypothetical protein